MKRRGFRELSRILRSVEERLIPKLGPFQRLACALGMHRRSGSHSHRHDDEWHSFCVGCEASMVKRDGAWQLERDVGPR
jgi:hypothetical protein